MKSNEASGRIPSLRAAITGIGLTIVAAGLLLAPASSAEVPAQGSAKMVLGSGQSAKALSKARVKITSVNADTPVPLSKGRVQLSFPVRDVSVAEDRSVVSLVGSLVFSKGKKRVTVGQLSMVSRDDGTVVRGRLGGSVTTVLRAGGPAEVNTQVGTVAIAGRTASLSKSTARSLARKFKIRKLPASKLGNASTTDIQAAFSDPYGELCNLPATSKTAGDLPRPTLDPEIDNPTTATGAAIPWGIRSGLRSYLAGIGPQGLIQSEGATVGPASGVPPFAPSGFTWPFASGKFNSASTATGTDQAVISGSGTILLCHKTQFRVNLSNPAIVIDGLKAQLVFDVDTNVLGNWIPTQRVAVANLITSEVTPTRGPDSITWTNVPVSLTEAGSEALRLYVVPSPFRYQAGQLLEAITFTVSTS